MFRVHVFLSLFLVLPILATRPTLAAPGVPPSVTRSTDYSYILDGNHVACFLGNTGLVGHDLMQLRGRQDGFYFPNDYPINDMTLVYSAGLWLAGITSAEDTLVAVADYASEFTPGAWGAGAEDPAWRVYAVTDDPAGWTGWPVTQGAPLAANGVDPWIADLPGVNRMAWAVWNDGDPARHDNIAGSTAPLGVELRLTAWCSPVPDRESTVFLRWELLNQGENDFRQFWCGLWVDSDLGGSSDDLAGCAPERQLGFVYNGDNDDVSYGSRPPALGAVLLYGLHEPAAGDSAFYQDHWHAAERNLGLASCTVYNNGWDSQSFRQTLNLLLGRTPNGAARPGGVLDFAGNPVEGSGVLDTTPCDRRLLLGCGPVAFEPGERQEVGGALCAAQGEDRLASLARLFQVAPWPVGPSSAVTPPASVRPCGLELVGVWPNPFNPEARVEFTLLTPASSSNLCLYDLLGREVWRRELGALPAGRGETRLNPAGLASGLYLLRIQADEDTRVARVLVLR